MKVTNGADAPPKIAMALAMDVNRLIGKDGDMPWKIPGELAHFKAITLGKPVIMGRKTFDSIGRPLPGRLNIVVTRDNRWNAEGVLVTHSLEQALNKGRDRAVEDGVDEVFVIGGAGLCRDAMPVTERFYLTRVDKAYEGDTWLDSFNEDEWKEVQRRTPQTSDTGGIPIHYCVLERAA
jgi:dihydrofolate reductase